MQLSFDAPAGGDFVRSVGPDQILLASGPRHASFVMAAGVPVFDWSVTDVAAITTDDCAALIALQPAVLLLGTGPSQKFPAREIFAAFLTRGIGLEVMDNAAAARTYNVLLGEGRKVAAAFVLPPPAT
jgi:uncharacterized protein